MAQYVIDGMFEGRRVYLRWDDSVVGLVGDDEAEVEIEVRSLEAIFLMPDGPVILEPDPRRPGDAFYLAREVMHIDGISGDVPPPESIAA